MRKKDNAAKILTYFKTVGQRREIREDLMLAGTPLHLFQLTHACSNRKELFSM
jgi:hypothetical protein